MIEPKDAFWRTIINYQNDETPFVDAYARFGIGFEPRRTGPAFLYPRGTLPPNHENPFVQPVMQMRAEDDNQRFAVRPGTFSSLPWAAHEETKLALSGGHVFIKTCHVFEDAGRFLTEIELHTDAEALTPSIYWTGCLHEDLTDLSSFTILQVFHFDGEWSRWRSPSGSGDFHNPVPGKRIELAWAAGAIDVGSPVIPGERITAEMPVRSRRMHF